MFETQKQKKKFPCPYCKCTFTQIGSKKRHILTIHEKVKLPPRKKLKCTLCDKMLTSGKRKEHMQEVHEGLKPFECELCETKFFLESRLKIHMRNVHEGEKKFECNLCGVKFKGHLNHHIAAVHKGEKTFKCEIIS